MGSSATALTMAIISNLMLFLLLFGLSATVDLKTLKRQINNKTAILLGVVMQFVVMPLCGFISVVIFSRYGYTKQMATTLLVVTSSPGGAFSNWWCSTFNAELALSVAMTTISTTLSLALLPANLFLYTYLAFGTGLVKDGTTTADDTTATTTVTISVPAAGLQEQQPQSERDDALNQNATTISTKSHTLAVMDDPTISATTDTINAIPFQTLLISLGIVLSGVVFGLYCGSRKRFDTPQFHVYANRFGTLSGIVLIVISFAMSSGGGGSTDTWYNQNWAFYIATSTPCVLGLIIANVVSMVAKREPPETVSIAIECCFQNIGIASSVALTLFRNDPDMRAQAVAVPLFYGVVQTSSVFLYCLVAWKMGWTKAPPDEGFCTVISKTYEVSSTHRAHGTDDTIDEGTSTSRRRREKKRGRNRTQSEEYMAEHSRALSVSGHQRVLIGGPKSNFLDRLFPPVLIRMASSIQSVSSNHSRRNRNRTESTNSYGLDSFAGDDFNDDYFAGTPRADGSDEPNSSNNRKQFNRGRSSSANSVSFATDDDFVGDGLRIKTNVGGNRGRTSSANSVSFADEDDFMYDTDGFINGTPKGSEEFMKQFTAAENRNKTQPTSILRQKDTAKSASEGRAQIPPPIPEVGSFCSTTTSATMAPSPIAIADGTRNLKIDTDDLCDEEQGEIQDDECGEPTMLNTSRSLGVGSFDHPNTDAPDDESESSNSA